MDLGLVACNGLSVRRLDGSLGNIEGAAESITDVHGDNISRIPVAISKVGNPMNAEEMNFCAGDSGGGEECLEERSIRVEVGEAPLLVGE